jgi:HD-like signal output (HDOD) protein
MASITGDKQKTLEKLKKRMEEMKGLPAMAHSVRMVSKQTSKGSDSTVTDITDTILQDFSLTNKILHMVNTAHYIKTQSEGKINTISRAVIILGLDHVRNAALSLMLFENLKDKSLAKDLKSTLVNNFTSGIIAREIARVVGGEHKEEAFLCAMFHDFGKVLVTYYLSEESKEINDAVGKGAPERRAALDILGTSYESIGITVGKEWKLSNLIVFCMGKHPPLVPKPGTSHDALHAVVEFSHELCNIVNACSKDPKEWEKALKALLARFKGSVAIEPEKLVEILNIAHAEITDHANEFNLSDESLGILDSLGAVMAPLPGETPSEQGQTQVIVRVDAGGGFRVLDTVNSKGDGPQTPEEILSRGVQEVATSLLEDFSVSDILRMILEVMFRGMDFSNVVICIKNSKTMLMEGRFAFGLNTNAIKNSFRFTVDAAAKDVFNTAIARGADILVNDVSDYRVAPLIPEWFKVLLDSETFMLMPIVVNKISLGLIYADKPMAGDLNLDTQVLRYLKTLRDQAILAIKQKS